LTEQETSDKKACVDSDSSNAGMEPRVKQRDLMQLEPAVQWCLDSTAIMN